MLAQSTDTKTDFRQKNHNRNKSREIREEKVVRIDLCLLAGVVVYWRLALEMDMKDYLVSLLIFFPNQLSSSKYNTATEQREQSTMEYTQPHNSTEEE